MIDLLLAVGCYRLILPDGSEFSLGSLGLLGTGAPGHFFWSPSSSLAEFDGYPAGWDGWHLVANSKEGWMDTFGEGMLLNAPPVGWNPVGPVGPVGPPCPTG